MNKFLPGAVLCLFWTHAYSGVENRIDLDAPGALEKLAVETPEHFHVVKQVLLEASSRDIRSLGSWMAVSFGARDLRTSMVKMSFPAKRRLSFVLGVTSYARTVSLSAEGYASRAIPEQFDDAILVPAGAD